MKKWICVFSALICAPVSADVVVVVSAKSAVNTMDKQTVSDIFLGKAGTFPGGGQALPLDQSESSGLRTEFYDKVCSKNSTQLRAYWSKQIFSGKGRPPKEVNNSAEVKQLVANNPNSIGYIDKGSVDGSVKVVFSP
ncbi:ABC-type phosphate transport system substrate-binding protein [Gammaproteobacteria bacterium]